jgi:hypothetical protein
LRIAVISFTAAAHPSFSSSITMTICGFRA